MVRRKLRRSNRTPEWAAAGLAAVIHGAIAVTHGGPVAVPDVSAYLSVSQWPYGGVLPADLAYHPGYGLLLAPLGWLDGASVHTAALLFNGLMVGVCVVLIIRFVRLLNGQQWVAFTAAAMVVVHPSLSAASRIAWPETLFTVLLLLVGVLVCRSQWQWVGTIAGLSIAVHPRAIVIALAALAVAATERRVRSVLAGLLPALLLVGGLLQLTGTWPSARIDAAVGVTAGLGPSATISGQWIALIAGTAGFAAVGIAVGLTRYKFCPASGFLALSALGMLILGGWVLAGSDRIDTLLYGRYLGPWAIPLTAIGLVALSKREVTRRVIGSLVALTILALVVCLAQSENMVAAPRRIMTLGLGVLWSIFDNNLVAMLLISSLIAIIGCIAMMRGSTVALLMFGLLAVPSTVVNHTHLREVGEIADGQVMTAHVIPSAEICLAHDVSVKGYALWLYRLALPDMHHSRVSIAGGELPCGPYVVADFDTMSNCPSAELLGTEPRGAWAMWRYPSLGCG